MKKIKIIFMFFAFVIALLMITPICYGLELTSFDITSPTTGIYGEGTEVTFTMKFDEKIKGTMPTAEIYFGYSKSDGMVSQIEGQVFDTYTDTITYKYTIKAGDNGTLYFGGIVDGWDNTVEAEDGTLYYLSIYGNDFTNTIYADTTITRGDLTNATFEIDSFSTFDHCAPVLKVKNGIMVDNNDYYIHISNNKNEVLNIIGYNESILGNSEIWEKAYDFKNDEKISNAKLKNIVAEQGDIYIWVCEVDKTYRVPKIIVNGRKVTRQEQYPLGNRIKAYFFNDGTSTFCSETYGNNERKINLKIGKVTDNSILRAIQKGESNCLQKLLEYAKNAEAMYTGTVNLGEDTEITSSINLVNEEYYYVYMQLEDENGRYYPIEDVSLYQGCVGETVGKNLFDYLSNDFKWNLSEDKQKEEEKPADPTTAKGTLPDTGSGLYIIGLVLIAIVVAGVISYRKNNNIKIS